MGRGGGDVKNDCKKETKRLPRVTPPEEYQIAKKKGGGLSSLF